MLACVEVRKQSRYHGFSTIAEGTRQMIPGHFLQQSPVLRVVLVWLVWGGLSLSLINLLSTQHFERLFTWFGSLPYLPVEAYLPQLLYGLLFFVLVTALIRQLSYIKVILYSTATFLVVVFYLFAMVAPDSELYRMAEIFFGLNSPVWARVIYIIMWSLFFSTVLELLLIRLFSLAQYREQMLTHLDFDRVLHQHDLNYRTIQIVIWAIPTLGFLGTVVGISFALEKASDLPASLLDQVAVEIWFRGIVQALAYAFYTTIAGLVLSTILTLISSFISTLEEREINQRLSAPL